MRHLLLFAAPLALGACGADVSQSSGDPMPAPKPIASSEKPDQTQQRPEKQVTELAGSWTEADSANNGQRLEYASEDGVVAVSLTCQQPDAFSGEDGANALVLRRTYEDDEAPNQIGVLTSAGNGAITAQLDEETGEVTGIFDTRSQAARALANGEGNLRLVAGQSEYVVPTDDRVEQLVESCRPPIEATLEGEAEADADAEEADEPDGETPSGS
ncbi:MAG: hypothetical protein ABJL57_14795 [Hyphomonas sp.]|jgi:hypothetical protein|uniref:hypothetical protein n=1 Tax=Hyphomonas sp. TaxID=87 RepID=UPI0032665AF0|tara:strand:- start:102 stop:746 length:645 start_codon:yes stop_codon:yes gene_type:complete